MPPPRGGSTSGAQRTVHVYFKDDFILVRGEIVVTTLPISGLLLERSNYDVYILYKKSDEWLTRGK